MAHRTVSIRMECTPEQYDAIANAAWALVNAAGLASDWRVERDGQSDPATLNSAGRDSPDWT